jgi:UDP-N-acetylmuramate--alanine ligase
MIGWTLTRAGRDPTFVLGTSVPQLGGWARLGSGPHAVVEAIADGCAREDWARLAPALALLLDGEAGPADPSRVAEWQALAHSVPADGRVLALAGGAAEAAGGPGPRLERLALERGSEWWGACVREDRGRFRFRAFHRGRFILEAGLQVPGRRNVLAALATVAACQRLDVPAPEIRQALEEFAGVSRDFESRGNYRGVTLVDDEADGPEALGAALQLGRRVYGVRRIWAVLFAPQGMEAPELRNRYSGALAPADEVVLAGSAANDVLASACVATGLRVRQVASLDDAILVLDRHLEPGDVLVTLGAGDVGTIIDAFIRRLPRDRPGR